ncbi:class I SAM-dependent methyltransferase [Phenylobacterium sp.]|uniref:class I SAM-dependent methyltransferase n=1 Tax=Phenylobacterium sp. TaxID=1871053 RepID=UPI00272F87EA|nr:class I SAM-dependent methyltransferase [Phenylobacterium sp.]MDP2215237.1 class I SAM-dependent methyltransferase [Phenylobacterium sp.]
MSQEGLYGLPPRELAEPGPDAAQFSPLIPGSEALDDQPDQSLDGLTILAPPGTVERRYVLAQGLRALKVGGTMTALAPKAKGGSRLGKELKAFGLEVAEDARRHHRICVVVRPAELDLSEALAAGAPRLSPELGLWTQPGIFSWDRIDPGTALLLSRLPTQAGVGADFGCGLGLLAHGVLASQAVTGLTLIDIDRRAVACATRNVSDARAQVVWADIRQGVPALSDLDFVVMNPPFHDGGAEDRALGAAFIAQAAGVLRHGGKLLMVANRHLPYERPLADSFGAKVKLLAEEGGYKLYEARR